MSNLFIPYIGMDKVVSQQVSASLSGYQDQLNTLSANVRMMTILSGYDDTQVRKFIENETNARIDQDNTIKSALTGEINLRAEADQILIASVQKLSQQISALNDSTYTQAEIDEVLNTKANSIDVQNISNTLSEEIATRTRLSEKVEILNTGYISLNNTISQLNTNTNNKFLEIQSDIENLNDILLNNLDQQVSGLSEHISILNSNISAIEENLGQEISARIDADEILNSNISAVEENLNQQISNRISINEQINSNILLISEQLSAEILDRIAITNKLESDNLEISENLNQQISARIDADEVLSADILAVEESLNQQISTRIDADEILNSNILAVEESLNQQISARIDADEILSADILAVEESLNQQISARIDADEILTKIKDQDYTAFEVFPRNFGINAKVQIGKDENDKAITKPPKFSEVFGDWVEIGNNIIPNIGFEQLFRINQVISRPIDGSTDKNYYRFNPFNQGDEQYVLLTSGIKEVTELPEVGDPYALYKLYDSEGTLIMQYLYAIPEIKALRSCFTTAQDYYYISLNQPNINIQTSFSLAIRSSISNVEDLDIYIDFGDGSKIYHISDPEIYLGKNGQFYSFSYEYKEVNKNYVVKIYGSKYFAIQFSRTPKVTHHIVTNYLTPELPLAKHIKNFASMFNAQLIYKLNPPRYTYDFNSCNISSDSFPDKLQSISAIDPTPVSIYNMSGMWKNKQYLQKFAFTIPAIIESGSTASMDSTFYNMSFLKPFDILGLFKSYSLIGMKGSTISVSNLFANTQNITCSNYQKLGKFLWNNPDITWTNTSTAFTGCPDELRANIPEQWGGTLTGWTAPVKLTKEYVDNISGKISIEIDNAIYDDTQIRADIVELSSKIQNFVDNDTIYDDTQIKADIAKVKDQLKKAMLSGVIYDDTAIVSTISYLSADIEDLTNTIITDGFGNKFLADNGQYYELPFENETNLNTQLLSTYLDENGYLKVVPTEFITEAQLEQKNFVNETTVNEKINSLDYINAQYLIDNKYITQYTLPQHIVITTLLDKIAKLQDTVETLQDKIYLMQRAINDLTIDTDEQVVYVDNNVEILSSIIIQQDQSLSRFNIISVR